MQGWRRACPTTAMLDSGHKCFQHAAWLERNIASLIIIPSLSELRHIQHMRAYLNEGLELCPRFIDIHDGVTDMGIREIDMGHSPIPSRHFDSSANIDSVLRNLRNSTKDRECLLDPFSLRPGVTRTRISHSIEAVPKMFFRFLKGFHSKWIPDHAGRRSHMPADGEIRSCSDSDEFHKRFFSRADVGNEDTQPGPVRFFIDGFDQIAVLDKGAPYFTRASGDWALQQF